MQDKILRRFLLDKNSGQMSRLLKRLRVHSLIKNSRSHLQVLSDPIRQGSNRRGPEVEEPVIIPQLAFGSAA